MEFVLGIYPPHTYIVTRSSFVVPFWWLREAVKTQKYAKRKLLASDFRHHRERLRSDRSETKDATTAEAIGDSILTDNASINASSTPGVACARNRCFRRFLLDFGLVGETHTDS